jgi:hypothetical protein
VEKIQLNGGFAWYATQELPWTTPTMFGNTKDMLDLGETINGVNSARNPTLQKKKSEFTLLPNPTPCTFWEKFGASWSRPAFAIDSTGVPPHRPYR